MHVKTQRTGLFDDDSDFGIDDDFDPTFDLSFRNFTSDQPMEITARMSVKAQRDYELVKRATEKGDQQAYAHLLNSYRDTLYFMLLKMTNNPHDADDLTIEAFGKAFKHLHLYTPDHAFSTWLFRIASNNCIDFLRKRKNNLLVNTSFSDGENALEQVKRLPDTENDPEENLIQTQKSDLLRQVVEKLKPHYRKLVIMRYFEELSYEEIAEQMDLPLGSVKGQLFRAREFLYQILKNKEEML